MTKKTILILGGSYVGLAVAHKLLKTTLTGTSEYQVILVSPSSHHYWNLASVRAIVPGQIENSKIFAPIEAGFKQYPASTFSFVLGSATALDTDSKSVTITTNAGAQVIQAYDTLVVSTGSRYAADTVPWKLSAEGYEKTLAVLKKTQDSVKAAKSIVISGGGPTGVESAAEIAFEYGKNKEVTLVTAGSQLLTGVPPSVASTAENELKKLGVKIIYGSKVLSASKSDDGSTQVTLSDNQALITDLYLPTNGVKANTEFLPKHLLNEVGDVKVDEFFRVKGADRVWAAGDVADIEDKQLAFAQGQAAHLSKNLDLVFNGKEPVAYKRGPPMMAVTLGRSKATGRRANMKLPSLMIWFVKGRTLFMQNQKGLVDGSAA